jgi:RNA polymerase sigma-70 factor (ECF subfamily)
MEQQETNLIKRAQGGDTRAFDTLVRLHDRRILQITYSMLNNLQDAQDVYQETFLRAFSKLGTYRYESRFSTWLGRIAINLSINRRKQRKRRQWFSLDEKTDAQLHFEMETNHRDLHTTETIVAKNELYEQIQNSLGVLSEQQRAAFTLKHLHGYKITEISEMMNCAEGTVKNYLFRATQKLKKKLMPYYKVE